MLGAAQFVIAFQSMRAKSAEELNKTEESPLSSETEVSGGDTGGAEASAAPTRSMLRSQTQAHAMTTAILIGGGVIALATVMALLTIPGAVVWSDGANGSQPPSAPAL